MISYEPGTAFDVQVGKQTFAGKTLSARAASASMKAYSAALEAAGTDEDKALQAMVDLINTRLVTPVDTAELLTAQGMNQLYQLLRDGGTVTDADAKK